MCIAMAHRPDNHVTVIDFGLCTTASAGVPLTDFCGTPGRCARAQKSRLVRNPMPHTSLSATFLYKVFKCTLICSSQFFIFHVLLSYVFYVLPFLFCAVTGFFAPEMISAPQYDGFAVDVWSVGCVLLELLLGHEEFVRVWMPAYSYDHLHDAQEFLLQLSGSMRELRRCLPDTARGGGGGGGGGPRA